jgi:glycosyltransferase involved in cell wall biosynthesis
MLRLCRDLGVRIWHAHDYKSNALGLLLRPFHSMRLVTTVHGWVTRTSRTPVYYAVDRWCLARYDAVICVSEDLAEQAQRAGVVDTRRLLLPNGVDTELFCRHKPAVHAELRRQFGVPPGRLVVGAMGRLSYEKGFDVLLRGLATVLEDGIDCELWIAGEGPEEAALRGLVHALGLSDRVRLMGFQNDTLQLYEAFDVFVLSSRREGLPNVVLEALAAEVPVVATRMPGLLRVLRDGHTALMVDIDDVSTLSVALRRLLNNVALRADLARAGRTLVETRYSFARRVSRELTVYDSLLHGNGATVGYVAHSV